MNERRLHQVFKISVLLKGADALVEIIAGLLVGLVSASSIRHLVNLLTHGELTEDPHDFIATHLLKMSQSLRGSTQHFYAFYLLGHGAIKVLLVIGLLKNKLWAYPASLVVLGLFIVYQVYLFSQTHGTGLMVLTVFDLFVMLLIWHEYRLVRRHRKAM